MGGSSKTPRNRNSWREGGANQKVFCRGVWIFSGTTHCCTSLENLITLDLKQVTEETDLIPLEIWMSLSGKWVMRFACPLGKLEFQFFSSSAYITKF